MSISTHVLDTVKGTPASGLTVTLRRREGDAWTVAATAVTGGDGRVAGFEADAGPGDYQLEFAAAEYFARDGRDSFYPTVQVTFKVGDVGAHHHVPLLLAPFGYTTYRGS